MPYRDRIHFYELRRFRSHLSRYGASNVNLHRHRGYGSELCCDCYDSLEDRLSFYDNVYVQAILEQVSDYCHDPACPNYNDWGYDVRYSEYRRR